MLFYGPGASCDKARELRRALVDATHLVNIAETDIKEGCAARDENSTRM
jgi:hypothetical protein